MSWLYWIKCETQSLRFVQEKKSQNNNTSWAPSAGQLKNHVRDLCWPLYVPFCRMRHIMLVLNNKIQFQSQRAMIGSSRGEERGYDSLFLQTIVWFCCRLSLSETCWILQHLVESCKILRNLEDFYKVLRYLTESFWILQLGVPF